VSASICKPNFEKIQVRTSWLLGKPSCLAGVENHFLDELME